MSRVNYIVTCSHKECKYFCEGECTKEVLYVNDKECKVLKEKDSSNENSSKCNS